MHAWTCDLCTVGVHACMYVCSYVHAYVCLILKEPDVCMHACMYVGMYVRMYAQSLTDEMLFLLKCAPHIYLHAYIH